MKKLMSIFCVLAMFFCLCACGSTETEESYAGISESKKEQGNQMQNNTHKEVNGLISLTSTNYAYCNTDDGYYYISEDSVKLKDGSYGAHIMYMDFATEQEVYLCSDTGCSHDDKSCNAVLSEDEFVILSSRIFVWNGKLYLLSKDYDTEGSVVIDGMNGQEIQAETKPAVLYQMNLDGTNRKKIYTFADGVTLEDTILATNDNVYFVTKKLETNMEENVSVTTAQNRNLVKLDPVNSSLETITSMDMGDGISWGIIGCFDNSLVLGGISYEDGDSSTSDISQEEWKELYSKSKSVYATFNLDSKKFTEVYQIKNTGIHAAETKDGILYVSNEASQEIQAIDLRSGKNSTLTSLRQNNIIGVFSDMLVCQTWDLTDDYTLYFVNIKNGEVSHCVLTNQFNGWALELICEAGNDALVIYDYKADPHSDGSYEIHQYKYALIAKEALYAGKNEFRPIEMIGKGH